MMLTGELKDSEWLLQKHMHVPNTHKGAHRYDYITYFSPNAADEPTTT